MRDVTLPRECDDSVARFTDPTEVRPDVILGRDPSKPWFMVDVQISRDGEKIFRWPLSWLLVRLERKRPGDLLVITHDPKIAEWARTGIVANGTTGPMLTMHPKVLLLDQACVQRLLKLDSPWSAFAAAWTLQDAPVTEETLAIVWAALRKIDELDPELQGRMIRPIVGVLSEPINKKANENMSTQLWPNISDEQLDNSPGVRIWREAAERIGEARGEARGEATGEARAIVLVLQARSVALSDEQRERIETCTDKALLDQWVLRAATATTADDLFRE